MSVQAKARYREIKDLISKLNSAVYAGTLEGLVIKFDVSRISTYVKGCGEEEYPHLGVSVLARLNGREEDQ